MRKSFLLTSLFSLFLSACDPNFGIGLRNSTRHSVKFIANGDFGVLGHLDTVVLNAGEEKIFSGTFGMYGIQEHDISFDKLKIISNNDTVEYEGKDNIIKAFRKISGEWLIDVK